KKIIADEKERIYKIGRATIKEIRGGTEEQPEGLVYSPRFENLQQGTFKNIHKIDIKSCYANIMRDYPLPYGEPTYIKDPDEISKQLQAGKSGFVRFYLKNGARIKNQQIPFVSDCYNEIKGEIRGRLLLYTLAVSHVATLKTYYLYRQFKPEDVLAIRSDCIYVKGELPDKFLKEKSKYHITKYRQ
ncbi:8159_t:CDS:2, partial [Racocetra fulgida]